MTPGRAALVGGCLVVATCLPLDERVIPEERGGEEAGAEGAGATAGKSAGGKGGSSAAGGSEAGASGEAGGEQGGTGGGAGAGGSKAGSGGAGGGSKGGSGGAAGSSGGAAGSGGDGGSGGVSGGGAAGSSSGTAGSGGMGVPCGTVEPGLDLEIDYVTGVTGATDIAFHSDGRAVVTQKGGTVTVRRTDGMQTTLNGKFPNIDAAGEKGLLGVAADPDTDTFYFYVSDGTSTTDKHRVLKGTLTAEHDIVIDGTPVIGATVGNGPGIEGPNNLVGGGLVIHDGYLYVSVGDAGYNAQPPTNKHASCLNKPNGKILRVNLDGSIPNDNPLFGTAMVTSCATPTGAFSMAAPDRRIFAWGLRNPWRFWVDPLTNLLWVGDVGERGREEISVGPGGTHFGWPFYEGTTAYTNLSPMTCAMMSPSKSCTPPVYDYPTDDGASVTGGLIPDGCGWDNVWDGNEYYVWGDWSNDTVHGIQVTSDHAELFVPHSVIDVLPMSFNGPASMRMGPDDSLYIVLNSANAVYRLTPKSRCGPKCTGN